MAHQTITERYGLLGWQQMSNMVHEVDAKKIDDYRDDIDTLLVFAGLFSAVLTALLVESYTMLLPDPGYETPFLLRQLIMQNYTLSSSHLNSTAPIIEIPPFEAPLWAVRVNALWFASLVCSLGTASAAILVKQWLREYLVIKWTVPQERIRARQYRTAAIEEWKALEIAAALPLLLQTSHGLFFLGLCIFTAAIDERIGRSTTALVAGWTVFVAITTMAPLLSPRCPYKVTLLTNLLKDCLHIVERAYTYLFRRCIPRLARTIWHGLAYPADMLLRIGAQSQAYIDRFPKLVRNADNKLKITAASVMAVIIRVAAILPSLLYKALCMIVFIGISLGHALRRSFFPFLDMITTNLSSSFAPIIAGLPWNGEQEGDAIRNARDDAQLLLSIDAAMVNDTFLPPIWDLLQRTSPTPDTLVTFAYLFLKHRSGTSLPLPDTLCKIHCPFYLPDLSQIAWDTVVDIVHTAFKIHDTTTGRLATDNSESLVSPWAQAGIYILLSKTRFPPASLPPSVAALFSDHSQFERTVIRASDASSRKPSQIYVEHLISIITAGANQRLGPGKVTDLWEEMVDGISYLRYEVRQLLLTVVHADITSWMEQIDDLRTENADTSSICGAMLIMLAMVEDKMEPKDLVAIGETFTKVMEILCEEFTFKTVHRFFGQSTFYSVSSKLSLVMPKVKSAFRDRAFEAALALYAVVAQRLLKMSFVPSAYFWCNWLGALWRVPAFESPLAGAALVDAWKYLRLVADEGLPFVSDPSWKLLSFASLQFIRATAPYNAIGGDDPNNPWLPLIPLIRTANTILKKDTSSDNLIDLRSSTEDALRRITTPEDLCLDRFPRKLLMAVLSGVSGYVRRNHLTPEAPHHIRAYLKPHMQNPAHCQAVPAPGQVVQASSEFITSIGDRDSEITSGGVVDGIPRGGEMVQIDVKGKGREISAASVHPDRTEPGDEHPFPSNGDGRSDGVVLSREAYNNSHAVVKSAPSASNEEPTSLPGIIAVFFGERGSGSTDKTGEASKTSFIPDGTERTEREASTGAYRLDDLTVFDTGDGLEDHLGFIAAIFDDHAPGDRGATSVRLGNTSARIGEASSIGDVHGDGDEMSISDKPRAQSAEGGHQANGTGRGVIGICEGGTQPAAAAVPRSAARDDDLSERDTDFHHHERSLPEDRTGVKNPNSEVPYPRRLPGMGDSQDAEPHGRGSVDIVDDFNSRRETSVSSLADPHGHHLDE